MRTKQTPTGSEGVQSKLNPASQIRSEEKNVGVGRRRRGGVVRGSGGRDDDQGRRGPRVLECRLWGLANGSNVDQVDLGRLGPVRMFLSAR